MKGPCRVLQRWVVAVTAVSDFLRLTHAIRIGVDDDSAGDFQAVGLALDEPNNTSTSQDPKTRHDADNPGLDAWKEATDLVKQGGGSVSGRCVTANTKHGGAEVRGIVARAAIPDKTLLLNIPKKLWLHLDNFPEIKKSSLDCGLEVETKTVTAIAMETVKGEKSSWHKYLRTLPSYENYQSFYPRWAPKSFQKAFKGLALTELIRKGQKEDREVRKCWEAWHAEKANWEEEIPDMEKVTWKDVKLAFAQFRSRNHNVSSEGDGPGSGALLPAADLMNTIGSTEKLKINTFWGFLDDDHDGQMDRYALRTTEHVPADAELFERYCATCDNTVMIDYWGIYLEDNENKISVSENCEVLLPKAMALLKKSLKDENHNIITAPRCKSEVFEHKRGPLLCSLARLAYESCTATEDGSAKQPEEEEAIKKQHIKDLVAVLEKLKGQDEEALKTAESAIKAARSSDDSSEDESSKASMLELPQADFDWRSLLEEADGADDEGAEEEKGQEGEETEAASSGNSRRNSLVRSGGRQEKRTWSTEQDGQAVVAPGDDSAGASAEAAEGDYDGGYEEDDSEAPVAGQDSLLNTGDDSSDDYGHGRDRHGR
eukprot:TRINITY_DN38892_c0_g1_i1.p1 TRINITY_DN38892_c0_g1~~TRINITY_DN38892_c0_g1_i1.p1  ORF type:complete len:600 (+),score=195.89 TRINITY_DN38892_c0_g1_i1:100-1899(+)